MKTAERTKNRLSPAECAIRAFGGVCALALALDVYPSTVSRWRSSLGRVPAKAMPKILRLARERGLDLSAEDLVEGRGR